MEINGYVFADKWINSVYGKAAIAERDGKKYCLNKFMTFVEPVDNGVLDARTIAKNKENFDKTVAHRKKVNAILRRAVGSGGHIAVPLEEFVYDHHYYEVFEVVDNIVPENCVISTITGLDKNRKVIVLLNIAGALAVIHRSGIIHGNLSTRNILLIKNEAGVPVAELTGLENFFYEGELPDEIISDFRYSSPELAVYCKLEGDERKDFGALTKKTDIFSLGIIFHELLTGEFPQAVSLTEKLQNRMDNGHVIYACDVLNSGCELRISPKVGDAGLMALIADMLKKDPAGRPDADEVYKRLKIR